MLLSPNPLDSRREVSLPRTKRRAPGTEENPWPPDPRLRRAEVKQGTRESSEWIRRRSLTTEAIAREAVWGRGLPVPPIDRWTASACPADRSRPPCRVLVIPSESCPCHPERSEGSGGWGAHLCHSFAPIAFTSCAYTTPSVGKHAGTKAVWTTQGQGA